MVKNDVRYTIDNFINKSVKMPSYAPVKLVMKKWNQWCIENPNGTYADWKNYLDSLKKDYLNSLKKGGK